MSISAGSVVLIAALALVGLLVVNAIRYHRALLLERPVTLWRQEWATAGDAARALATATGLQATQRPKKWRWASSLLLTPVWFLWGDIFGSGAFRPEAQLTSWVLEGAGPRAMRIELGLRQAILSIGCTATNRLWVSRWLENAPWPLDAQEGMQTMFPVGGERWRSGASLVERAFALGLDRVATEDTRLSARTPLTDDGPLLDQYPAMLEAMVALAAWLEQPR